MTQFYLFLVDINDARPATGRKPTTSQPQVAIGRWHRLLIGTHPQTHAVAFQGNR